MRHNYWFRVFNYLTLALAGVCLAQGESFFLPILAWLLIPYFALLFFACRWEGQWTLSAWVTNALALVAITVIALWYRLEIRGEGPLRGLPPLLALVPFTGPFIMALTAVQVFRPRQSGDYWLLQAMGLAQVALGAVLATTPVFGLLAAVYLIFALGSLALHYLAEPLTALPKVPWLWVSRFLLFWMPLCSALTLGLFLLVPRMEGSTWDPFERFSPQAAAQNRETKGYLDEVNLQGTQTIQLSRDIAFHFRVEQGGMPKIDIPLESRFRGTVFENYGDGVWSSISHRKEEINGRTRERQTVDLPDFGPNEYFVNFDIATQQSGGLFLMEPVLMGPRGMYRSPVKPLMTLPKYSVLFFEETGSGTLVPSLFPGLKECRYKQVMAPVKSTDRCPAEISKPEYIGYLTQHELPALEMWTTKLLKRLVDDGRYELDSKSLVPDPRWPDKGYTLKPEFWEPVARAFCTYLSGSLDYQYSLEQKRVDYSLDPTEDFLFNVRQGHCERFASAFVLMLRTQGVPARIVKGFHGCEASGDGGYRVRHSMAHAWAEVLVPRKEPGPAYDWLSLDPSPSGDRVITTAAADWWQDKTKAGASVWQNLIVGFNAEKQAGVLEAAAGPFLAYQTAFIEDLPYFVRPFIGFILAGVGWYAYSAWKRWNAKRIRRPPAFPLFKTVQTVARLHGGPTYNTGQTPLEYAEKVRTWQMGQSLAIERVDVPRRVAELLYRVRFGDHIAGAGELTQLQEQVQLWSADLRSAARG